MFVSESMKSQLVAIEPGASITEVRELMVKHTIRHLPVIGEAGELMGVVSDRDVRDAMPSTLLAKELYEKELLWVEKFTARDIMTENPVTISPIFTIQDALIMIQEKRVGAFPVVDQEGKLSGILSVSDLLRAFTNVMGIGEPGTLLCIIAEEKTGELKKIVDAVTEEGISLGSVLVARYWDDDKRAVFPYLLTNNVARIRRKLQDLGFSLIDPRRWYLDQLPSMDE